ncbi:MAG: hypothetical protein EXS36_17030 [Pedosphaera sp.]|nr:hypothetical protein [Pedosphaera sp.]
MSHSISKSLLLVRIVLEVGLPVGLIAADKTIVPGLASKYPGDAGIAKDPAVLFYDDFEDDAPGKLWDEVKTRGKSATPAAQLATEYIGPMTTKQP